MLINYYEGFTHETFFNISKLKNRINKEEINFDMLNAAIYYCTNNERNRINLPLYQFHEKLLNSSFIHSSQMKLHKFFSHENPYEKKYRTLNDRINSLKSNNFNGFLCYGENLADYPVVNSLSTRFKVKNIFNLKQILSTDRLCEIHPFTYIEFAKNVVEGWMNSPGHKENILNSDFKFLGCSCTNYERKVNAIAGSITYFKITQNFGGNLF